MALPYASLQVYNPDSTCRWPCRMIYLAAPRVSGRTCSGYIGISAAGQEERCQYKVNQDLSRYSLLKP